MLRNYLLITFRNFRKNKIYSLLNILGLTIGISCAILIGLYVYDEITFDRFHKNLDDIYRLRVTYYLPNEGGKEEMVVMGPPVGVHMAEDYPEVVQSVRMLIYEDLVAQREDHTRFYETINFADPDFFQLFTFPLKYGDANTALDEPNSVVISQEIAQRYFDSEDVLGKTISFPEDSTELTITGILEDIPTNSHLQFDMLASMRTIANRNPNLMDCWWCFSTYTYLKLEPGTDPIQFGDKIKRISANYIADQEKSSGYYQEYFLQPMKDIHLRSDYRGEMSANSKEIYVIIFITIAIFILAIASINFMNLSTAQSTKRAKEIGLRKVSGAHKNQLVFQFLGESIMMVLLSALISLLIVNFMIGVVNDFTGKALSISTLFEPVVLLIFLSFIIILGLFAGSYPALLLSSLKPSNTLKGDISATGKGAFSRRLLVVFQFTLSVFLITGSIIAYKQLYYLKNMDLGFEKDQVVYIPTRHTNNSANSFKLLKQSLDQYPEVISSSLSSNVPGIGMGNNVVRKGTAENGELSDMRFLAVDYDFLDLYGIEILAGRGFEEDRGTDGNAFMLNEAGMKRLGWSTPDEALGKTLGWTDRTGEVIGIVKDFHFMSANQTIEPFIIVMNGSRTPGYLSVKMAAKDYKSVLKTISSEYKRIMPNKIFEYEFLDTSFDNQLQSEERFMNLFTFFTILGIFVACMGLYGLVLFTTQSKFREIGIRKVLGATPANIWIVLTSDFIKLILVSILLAIPIAYYFGKEWLSSFPYRTHLSWWLFVIVCLLTLFIAIVTVSYNCLRAARIDPVKTIANE